MKKCLGDDGDRHITGQCSATLDEPGSHKQTHFWKWQEASDTYVASILASISLFPFPFPSLIHSNTLYDVLVEGVH